MNDNILKIIVRVNVRNAGEKGINPDVLRDIICEKYEHVLQEYFDSIVQGMENIKLVGDKLYASVYVCSCGCLKSPTSFFCYQCIADKKEDLLFFL